MAEIVNPVIRGFFPDPSIVRVGADYYIANSSFEWFPGVPIHHSRDLVNWRLIGHALTKRSQVDLRGVPDSGGVWAPSLSYHGGKFWLVYTNVVTWGMGRPFKDVKVYVATAENILGPWSEPVELPAAGFDPSLFHDEDGRKWLVNMVWDFRKGKPRFGGIVVQEFDAGRGKLVGEMVKVLEKGVLIEGPNIYKKDGWYYLMVAEGGTGWNHGVSMARSRQVTGPYEVDPVEAVLTSRDHYGHALQKAGHGELVETTGGEWFLAHLASRPVGFERRCVLGRETCLQRVEWRDGWLRLAQGGHHPAERAAGPAGVEEVKWPVAWVRDEFEGEGLGVRWSALRGPMEEGWVTMRARKGWLRIFGRESMHSLGRQSLVAVRQTALSCVAETRVAFEPRRFTQMAGLVCYYSTRQFFYLRVTHLEGKGTVVGVTLTDNGVYDELGGEVSVKGWESVWMRAQIVRDRLQFWVSKDGEYWEAVGPVLDMSKNSDDYGVGFTGSMMGLCVQDLANGGGYADFGYFELREVGG